LVDKPLSESEITELTNGAEGIVFSPDIFSPDRVQTDTDQEYWKWAPGVAISAKDFQSLNDKYFYLFIALAYTDRSLAPKHYFVTGYASLVHGDVSALTIIRSGNVTEHVAP
jgi:hypothetical protein